MPTTNTQSLDHALPNWIWLASRSPRRRALLESIGIEVRVFLAQTEMDAEQLEAVLPEETPLSYVQRVTQLKLISALNALQTNRATGLVLAADTTVALHQHILGKPNSPEEACAMLVSLSGHKHQVHTAIAVCPIHTWLHQGPQSIQLTVQTSEVQFAELPMSFIQAYIESGEPFDKAGGYGIQGIIGQYVKHISGSHSGIMGLPLFETSQLLRNAWRTALSHN